MNDNQIKPLGRKTYGKIPHLSCSRLGDGDYKITAGEERILTEKVRDSKDNIIVTEKLDGCNMAVAKIDGKIVPLGRAGYLAETAPYPHMRLFARYVYELKYKEFDSLLGEGDWCSGEWMALAHGTIYDLGNEGPYHIFDIFSKGERIPFFQTQLSVVSAGLKPVYTLVSGHRSFDVSYVMSALGRNGNYGARDGAEGAVWRLERDGKYQMMAKYVNSFKEPGKYLPEISGDDPIWLWKM